MQIDINTEFGCIQPLMTRIKEHLKTDADPATNGNRYNVVWGLIYDFIQQRKGEGGIALVNTREP